MTATQKLEMIKLALAAGATVNFATYTRITAVSPKTAAKWEKAGRPLFKVSGNSLFIARGLSFDCVDLSQITFAGDASALETVRLAIVATREAR